MPRIKPAHQPRIIFNLLLLVTNGLARSHDLPLATHRKRLPQTPMLTSTNLDVMGGSDWRAGLYARGEYKISHKLTGEALVGAWGLSRKKTTTYLGVNYQPFPWANVGAGLNLGKNLIGPAGRVNN